MALCRKNVKKLLQKTGYTNIKIEYKDFLLPNTPEFLIRPLIVTGTVLEKIPLLKMVSQSIFISATRNS
jgi:hypothetical protein